MGGKTIQVSPQKVGPLDTKSGGKRDAYLKCIYSKEQGRLVIEVAGGRPVLPMAGRLGVKRSKKNCWPATTYRWPPMCAQHNHVVKHWR